MFLVEQEKIDLGEKMRMNTGQEKKPLKSECKMEENKNKIKEKK